MSSETRHIVIGSNSFLGRAVCENLVDKGIPVIGVYHKNTDNLLDGISQLSVAELFTKNLNVDVVYLVSAYIPSEGDTDIEKRLQAVNVDFVTKICEHFAEAKIVFCSSVAVYASEEKIITEKSAAAPFSYYGKSKLTAELQVQKHTRYAIVRISSIFGERMITTTFIPRIIQNAFTRGQIVLYGDGSRRQNYIHVNRVAELLIAAGAYPENDLFLAVSKKSFSNREIAEMIQQIIPNTTIRYEGEDESPSYLYNNEQTLKKLNLPEEDETLFEQLNDLITWMKKKY